MVAGVAPTLRPANRQFDADRRRLGYTPPSFNAFDRLTDVDTPLRSYQDLGGASLNIDWKLGPGRLTSTTAWRYWNWNPSSDRDFIGLPVTTISAAPSKQQQWTQEVRYAGDFSRALQLRRRRVPASTRRSIRIRSSSRSRAPRAARSCWRRRRRAATPGLLDGYGYHQYRDATATPARRCSASSNGRSPIGCACCPACASTTTRRTSTSISRSTAACRRPTRR